MGKIPSFQCDFVFACTSGDEDCVRELLDEVGREELCSGLIAASSRGHADICKLILRADPLAANYVDSRQWNALRSAACNNHDHVVDLLIKNGTQHFHKHSCYFLGFYDRFLQLEVSGRPFDITLAGKRSASAMP